MPDHEITTETPWAQLPGETTSAYAAFTAYLLLGPRRSIPSLAKKLGKKDHYVRQLATWKDKFDWATRTAAYSAWENEQLFMKVIEEKAGAELREYRDGVIKESKELMVVAKLLRSKGAEQLAEMDLRDATITQISTALRTAAQMAQASTDMGAVALGVDQLLESAVARGDGTKAEID